MQLWMIVLGVVLLTTIWVAFDAERYRVSTDKNKPYSVNTGVIPWLLVCLLLWIVAFPYYLIRRQETLGTTSSPPTPSDAAARIREASRLLDEGIITDDEFESKRAELLSEL